jgi:hypothetical protein
MPEPLKRTTLEHGLEYIEWHSSLIATSKARGQLDVKIGAVNLPQASCTWFL